MKNITESIGWACERRTYSKEDYAEIHKLLGVCGGDEASTLAALVDQPSFATSWHSDAPALLLHVRNMKKVMMSATHSGSFESIWAVINGQTETHDQIHQTPCNH